MDFIAKLLITAMFLYAGVVNPLRADQLIKLMRSKNMPVPDLLFPLSNILILCSSIAIILNVYVFAASMTLIVFMVAATYYFADFWNAVGMDREVRLNQFTSNITIIGGLLLLASQNIV